MDQLKDALVDGLVNNCLNSVPSDSSGSTGSKGTESDDSKSFCAASGDDSGGPVCSNPDRLSRSLWLYERESILLAKLDDVDWDFSVEELERLKGVCSSIPSKSHKLLEEIRMALWHHPKIPEFRGYYHVPSWKRTKADGTPSKNNCGNAGRHSRMMVSIIHALNLVIADRNRSSVAIFSLYYFWVDLRIGYAIVSLYYVAIVKDS